MRVGAQDFGAQHEVAAHRIGQLDPGDLARELVGEARGLDPVGSAPRLGAGPVAKARGIGQVVIAALHGAEHLRQQRRIVLVIGIHHRDDGRRGR
jgi:hypothetical protein